MDYPWRRLDQSGGVLHRDLPVKGHLPKCRDWLPPLRRQQDQIGFTNQQRHPRNAIARVSSFCRLSTPPSLFDESPSALRVTGAAAARRLGDWSTRRLDQVGKSSESASRLPLPGGIREPGSGFRRRHPASETRNPKITHGEIENNPRCD